MRVWIIDQDANKVIDIIPDDVWLNFSYDQMCKAYNIKRMEWVREIYTDFQVVLDQYKKVL